MFFPIDLLTGSSWEERGAKEALPCAAILIF